MVRENIVGFFENKKATADNAPFSFLLYREHPKYILTYKCILGHTR